MRTALSYNKGVTRLPTIQGFPIDEETRCIHYQQEIDVVAIQFACCGQFYPCYKCHAESAGHEIKKWPKSEFGANAIYCGKCRKTMAISDYLEKGECAHCGTRFNPGCARHYHIYFDV
ncbi:Uncharacterized conserved protein [Niallia circulans]|nr:Uncharacterized conserved protein [Niallia circulans]